MVKTQSVPTLNTIHRLYFNIHILTGVRPDVLQQTVLLSQSVQRVVSLTSGSDVTRQSVGGNLGGSSSLSVNVGNVDLDRGVVLGLDDSVRSRALSWDVQFHLMLVYVGVGINANMGPRLRGRFPNDGGLILDSCVFVTEGHLTNTFSSHR